MEILAFVIYFVAMLGIGVFFFIKSKADAGEKEYFLGGRQMGPWVTAMSAQASDMSAWLLMGLPGSIVAFGLGQAWIGIGLAIGTALNWIIVGKRLRNFSAAANDSITVPQYLSNRFASKNPALQIVCAVIFLVFFTIYVASSFVAGVTVFQSVFPQIGSDTALLIFAAIIIVYTFLGGYKAVCWTDFFQGIMILVALLAVPIVVVCTKDLGAEEYTANMRELINNIDPENIQKFPFAKSLFSASWQDIVSGLAWGLGYFGMPHILVRFMSIKKASMVKKSAIVAVVWVVIALGATIFVAYFGRMLIGDELLVNGAPRQQMVFIELSRMFFPGIIAGFLLSAIIAASMSTADSQLLVSSASFTSDIYKPVFRKNASEKETLWIGRIVVLVISVIAFFIARSEGEGAQAIMSLVDNAWAGFGAAFGPVILLSLFWKRFTYSGAIAGIISGGAAVVACIAFDFQGKTGIYEIIPGFIICFIFAIIVTLISKKPSAEATAIFEKATAPGYGEDD
ncbi:MAG: sodium/proline symporter PutP [Clostridia bacterium]|nr:sodium/proline symporter PutP [Clostridia bacterium]